MQISREGNLVTLINVFETTPEQQQALIDRKSPPQAAGLEPWR